MGSFIPSRCTDSLSHISPGYPFANGGGILSTGVADQLTKIKKSTISGNNAGYFGGGIASLYSATITVTNSTISGNESLSGAGLYIYDLGNDSSDVALNNATISGNTATSAFTAIGGVSLVSVLGGTPTLTARNSIVAEQAVGDDCSLLGAGSYVSAGYNIESGTTCSFTNMNGDQQNAAPGLLSLANNGGLTKTHALPVGSVAVNAGDPAGCRADMNGNGVVNALLLNDQRGETRTLNICDAGAYELQ